MNLISEIEYHTKMKFTQIGAPQPNDIILASARDSSQSFEKVDKQVLPFFKDIAQEIISKYSSEEAVCRALAIISGYTKNLKQKSLLNSNEGMVTIKLTGNIEGISKGTHTILRTLKKNFGHEIINLMRSMKIMKNENGVVFDIPETFKEEFFNQVQNLENNTELVIELCQELPELKEIGLRDNRGYVNNNYSRENGNNQNGYRNYDNSRGGRGYGNTSRGYGNSGGRYKDGGEGGFSRRGGDSKGGWGDNSRGGFSGAEHSSRRFYSDNLELIEQGHFWRTIQRNAFATNIIEENTRGLNRLYFQMRNMQRLPFTRIAMVSLIIGGSVWTNRLKDLN